MPYRSSNYLDSNTKEEIKNAISFFITAGWKNKDEIFERIAEDFDVSKSAVIEIYSEMGINRNNNKSE